MFGIKLLIFRFGVFRIGLRKLKFGFVIIKLLIFKFGVFCKMVNIFFFFWSLKVGILGLKLFLILLGL